MSFTVFYIACATVLITREVIAFDFIREIMFPRYPMLRRVRNISDEARSIDDDSTVLDTVGLIEKYGYPAEEHNITTEDGYNIVIFRIPGSPKSPAERGKPVVLVMHGMLASSDAWVLLGPEKDLPFLLADAGYDVWLGNIRGNSYGRSHTDLSPTDREFWDFSFHEIAMWDLPKMIDVALEFTDQKSLFYIGHSMGTTVGYILLSERPEYNDKIRMFIALAPIAFWKGPPPNLPVRWLYKNGVTIKRLFDNNGIFDLIPQTTSKARIGKVLCSDKSLTQPVCTAVVFMIAGEDFNQLNRSFLPQIIKYVPAGISTKILYHYQQQMFSGIFQPYDGGYISNFKLYGKKKPPIYDVRKITAPNAIIYGKNDILSIESNTDELIKRLQNIVTVEPVPFGSFNHFDFMWAINAKELLFDRIIELLSMNPSPYH